MFFKHTFLHILLVFLSSMVPSFSACRMLWSFCLSCSMIQWLFHLWSHSTTIEDLLKKVMWRWQQPEAYTMPVEPRVVESVKDAFSSYAYFRGWCWRTRVPSVLTTLTCSGVCEYGSAILLYSELNGFPRIFDILCEAVDVIVLWLSVIRTYGDCNGLGLLMAVVDVVTKVHCKLSYNVMLT